MRKNTYGLFNEWWTIKNESSQSMTRHFFTRIKKNNEMKREIYRVHTLVIIENSTYFTFVSHCIQYLYVTYHLKHTKDPFFIVNNEHNNFLRRASFHSLRNANTNVKHSLSSHIYSLNEPQDSCPNIWHPINTSIIKQYFFFYYRNKITHNYIVMPVTIQTE